MCARLVIHIISLNLQNSPLKGGSIIFLFTDGKLNTRGKAPFLKARDLQLAGLECGPQQAGSGVHSSHIMQARGGACTERKDPLVLMDNGPTGSKGTAMI